MDWKISNSMVVVMSRAWHAKPELFAEVQKNHLSMNSYDCSTIKYLANDPITFESINIASGCRRKTASPLRYNERQYYPRITARIHHPYVPIALLVHSRQIARPSIPLPPERYLALYLLLDHYRVRSDPPRGKRICCHRTMEELEVHLDRTLGLHGHCGR